MIKLKNVLAAGAVAAFALAAPATASAEIFGAGTAAGADYTASSLIDIDGGGHNAGGGGSNRNK